MSLSAPFSALEQRLNASVFKRLSNAVATFAGGEQVLGIFDEPHLRADVGYMDAASTRPSFTLPTAAIPDGPSWRSFFAGEDGPVDLRLQINGVDYRVIEHEPDGSGVSRLLLQRAVA